MLFITINNIIICNNFNISRRGISLDFGYLAAAKGSALAHYLQ